MMNATKSKTRFLVWLLPLSYALHIIEEYYGGEGLPIWLSDFINVDISNLDFIIINSIALSIVILFSIYHSFYKQNNLLFLALTALFFINGIVHLASSFFSYTYSPGTVTGVLLYLPIGVFLYTKIRLLLTARERSTGIALGIFIHLVVFIVALNI